MSALLADLKFAARTLLKTPSFTAIAILTLALGIGANTAIFSVVNAVLLRPLPFHDPDALVMVWMSPAQSPSSEIPFSFPDFQDFQRDSRTLSHIAAFAFNRYIISGPEGSAEARAALATPGLFPALGTPPLIGRTLTPADDRQRVVVLSHSLWKSRFNADPGVLTRTLTLNDEPHSIIGVMPPGFRFPTPDIDIWTSFAGIYATSGNVTIGNWLTSRNLHGYRVVARIAPGSSLAQAETEISAIASRLAAAYPESNTGLGARLVPVLEQTVSSVRLALLILLGAVGFVLLIACANVANLILARTASRRREIALRIALGASPGRLTRQLLTESALLGILGGALGFFFAVWGTQALIQLAPPNTPRLEEIRLDATVFAFTLGTSLLAALLFGLAPALQARRLNLADSFKDARGSAGSSPRARTRSVLVVAEVALSVVLLAGAGLLLRSFTRLLSADAGFNPDNVLTLHVNMNMSSYSDPQKQIAYVDRALREIESLPGVVAVGASHTMPPIYIQRGANFEIEGRPASPGNSPNAILLPVTPGYIRSLGIPLLQGRFISPTDSSSAPAVVVINQALARRYFPDQDPVGRRIVLDEAPRTVVGVIGDVKLQGLASNATSQILLPYSQSPFPGLYFIVRTAGDSRPLMSPVHNAFLRLDPGVTPTRVRTMDEVVWASVATPRANSILLGSFAALALVLASIGIYGVTAYSISRRTAEFGIRIALGAQRSDVLRLVLRQGMTLVFAGLAIGIAGSLVLTRYLATLLFQTRPTDPVTLIAVSSLLAAVAMLACYIPARRATRTDPLTALRHE